MTDPQNSDTTEGDEWHYIANGERKGPVSEEQLISALTQQGLSGDTPVWKKGFSDWQPLRDTTAGAGLRNGPPPVSSAHVNNTFVWILAVTPIFYTLASGWFEASALEDPYADQSFGKLVCTFVPLIVNVGLCIYDERQLRRAGYADHWLVILAILLAPIYLFARARRLKQFPSYGITWVCCFVVSLLLSLPGGFFLR